MSASTSGRRITEATALIASGRPDEHVEQDRRAIRLREIWIEAWRNFTCGASRGLVIALVFLVIVLTIAVVHVRSLVDLAAEAQAFRMAGASVTVVALEDSIDGAQCDALVSRPGVVSSGAIRNGESVAFGALPDRVVDTFEVTPGFAQVLQLRGGKGATIPGAWISDGLAATLGIDFIDTSRAMTLPLRDSGSITLVDRYRHPSDGRLPLLSNAIVAPVAPIGSFDSCWAELWPEANVSFDVMRLAINDQSDLVGGAATEKSNPTLQQLNSRLGSKFEGQHRFSSMTNGLLPCAGLAAGILLGLITIRLRRLEIASALHSGVDKTSLIMRSIAENIIWLIPSMTCCIAALYWAAIHGSSTGLCSALVPGVKIAVAAAVGVVIGAAIATLAMRESDLFQYFKAR